MNAELHLIFAHTSDGVLLSVLHYGSQFKRETMICDFALFNPFRRSTISLRKF